MLFVFIGSSRTNSAKVVGSILMGIFTDTRILKVFYMILDGPNFKTGIKTVISKNFETISIIHNLLWKVK